jgi:hypothetical protein
MLVKAASPTARRLPGVDGRSVWVRRCTDVIAAYIADLGGADNCSAAERSIIRRASTLTVELERFEVKFAMAGSAKLWRASPARVERPEHTGVNGYVTTLIE